MWKLKQLYKFHFIIIKIRVFAANNVYERFMLKAFYLRLKFHLLT